MADLIKSFHIPTQSKSTVSLSFEELREGLPIEVIHDYFEASRKDDAVDS